MNLSFSTAALFPRDTIVSIKLIERAGFPHAELMPQCLRETKPDFADEISRETSVKVGSIHFPLVFFSMFYNPYPGMRNETKGMIDDIVELGRRLETKIIVIHPPHFADDVVKELFEEAVFENLGYLCLKAQSGGIKVALENSPKGGREPKDLMEILEKMDSSNMFPMVDTTEAVESDQDPIAMIEKLDPIHLHVSDHRGNLKHLPPGEGELDWERIMNTLKEKEYDGFIVVEPAYRFFLKDPLNRMKRILIFLEGLMG